MQISPGKAHWISRRSRPHYCFDLGWILGVAFRGTLTRSNQPAQGFTLVRCCGSSRASSPHGLAASGPIACAISPPCSCRQLAVATNSPRKGLSPPIQCPCQAHLRPQSGATAAAHSHRDCRDALVPNIHASRGSILDAKGGRDCKRFDSRDSASASVRGAVGRGGNSDPEGGAP